MCGALTQGFDGTQEQLGLITGSLTSLLTIALSLFAQETVGLWGGVASRSVQAALPYQCHLMVTHEQILYFYKQIFIFGLLLKIQ